MSKQFFSMAAGIGTKNGRGEWLEVFYPAPMMNPNPDLVSAVAAIAGYQGGNVVITLDGATCHALEEVFLQHSMLDHALNLSAMETSGRPCVLTILETDDAPTTTPEAYLKLHLLSHRLVKPHGTDLTGIFPLLPNVAWTSEGAIDPEELPVHQMNARAQGRVLESQLCRQIPKDDQLRSAQRCAYCCGVSRTSGCLCG